MIKGVNFLDAEEFHENLYHVKEEEIKEFIYD